MVVQTTDLDISSQVGVLTEGLRKESAFARATPSYSFKVGETVQMVSFGDFKPQWVQEGARKPVSGSINRIEAKAQKLAQVTVLTNEAESLLGNLLAAIEADAPGFYGEQFDRTVAGEVASPSPLFHTLASAPEVNVSGGYAALNSVLGELPRGASAWVMSDRLFYSITGLTTTTGAPLIDPASETLLGLPVYRFRSDDIIGFVGDFKGSARHSITVNNMVRRSDQGTIVDSAGVEHHLFQDNKVAYVYEAFYAFIVRGATTNFRKLVWDTDPEA